MGTGRRSLLAAHDPMPSCEHRVWSSDLQRTRRCAHVQHRLNGTSLFDTGRFPSLGRKPRLLDVKSFSEESRASSVGFVCSVTRPNPAFQPTSLPLYGRQGRG